MPHLKASEPFRYVQTEQSQVFSSSVKSSSSLSNRSEFDSVSVLSSESCSPFLIGSFTVDDELLAELEFDDEPFG